MTVTLTQDRLKEFLDYCPTTGIFTRIKGVRRRAAGSRVGTIDKEWGHLRIGIDGKYYLASRLAWFYMFGVWPKEQIDHKNCDPLDNRMINLREATPTQNTRNKRRYKNNRSGYKGVYWHGAKNRWIASISTNGRSVELGQFSSSQKAYEAYCDAAIVAYGEYARLS